MSGPDEREGRVPGGADRSAGGEPDERDERFAAFLRAAAADYHRPPEAPREAMWAEIEAAWRAGAGDDDLPLEQPLAGAARTYHVPPDAPREAMWARIEGAWRLRAEAGESFPEPGVVPIRGRPGRASPEAGAVGADTAGRGEAVSVSGPGAAGGRSGHGWRLRRVPWAGAVGMAAVLLVGIAIGRMSVEEMGRTPGSGMVADAGDAGAGRDDAGVEPADRTLTRPEADAPSIGEDADAASGEAPAQRTEPGSGATGTDADAPDGRLADAGRGEPAAAPREEAGEVAVGEGPEEAGDRVAAAPRPGADAGVGGPSLAHRAATLDHFGRTEAFLTSFRTDAASGPDDRRLARWAGELLSDTRLLLDWSAGGDPRTRALLRELELVLAQIAGMEGGRADDERALIVEGLERGDVLPRLRATIPAGTAIPTRGV